MRVKIFEPGMHEPTFDWYSDKGEVGTVRSIQSMFNVDRWQVRGHVLEVSVKRGPEDTFPKK